MCIFSLIALALGYTQAAAGEIDRVAQAAHDKCPENKPWNTPRGYKNTSGFISDVLSD
jgi:hypothetical protein